MRLHVSASLAILIVTAAFVHAAQKADIKIRAEETLVDVLVTVNGKPVGDLTADDFEILDDGVRQEIQGARLQKQMPVTAIMVFDMSGSVHGEMLFHLKNAASRLLSDLKSDDKAALITFSNAVVLGSSPSGDLTRVKLALDQAKPDGNSSLIDASYAGLMLTRSIRDPTLLMIFSDGRDTMSWLTSDAVLEAAKRNEAVVYAVSTRRILNRAIPSAEYLFESEKRMPKRTFLGDLTDLTGGDLINIESTFNLDAVFLNILDEYRNRYLLAYTPRGVKRGGWHNIEVRVKNKKAKIKARPGYIDFSNKKD